MNKANPEELLRDMIDVYASNTNLLIHHIEDVMKNDHAVLGALINLLAMRIGKIPVVYGIEKMIPQTAWCKPTDVQNIDLLLLDNIRYNYRHLQ